MAHAQLEAINRLTKRVEEMHKLMGCELGAGLNTLTKFLDISVIRKLNAFDRLRESRFGRKDVTRVKVRVILSNLRVLRGILEDFIEAGVPGIRFIKRGAESSDTISQMPDNCGVWFHILKKNIATTFTLDDIKFTDSETGENVSSYEGLRRAIVNNVGTLQRNGVVYASQWLSVLLVEMFSHRYPKFQYQQSDNTLFIVTNPVHHEFLSQQHSQVNLLIKAIETELSTGSNENQDDVEEFVPPPDDNPRKLLQNTDEFGMKMRDSGDNAGGGNARRQLGYGEGHLKKFLFTAPPSLDHDQPPNSATLDFGGFSLGMPFREAPEDIRTSLDRFHDRPQIYSQDIRLSQSDTDVIYHSLQNVQLILGQIYEYKAIPIMISELSVDGDNTYLKLKGFGDTELKIATIDFKNPQFSQFDISVHMADKSSNIPVDACGGMVCAKLTALLFMDQYNISPTTYPLVFVWIWALLHELSLEEVVPLEYDEQYRKLKILYTDGIKGEIKKRQGQAQSLAAKLQKVLHAR